MDKSGTANQKIGKGSSNLIVKVHPLAVMNVSDHCNRAKYIVPKLTRVLGILLGK